MNAKTPPAVRELPVRIPKSLAGKDLRNSVGLGLVYVARGKPVPPVPEGETTTYRIKLDATAQAYLPVASRICGGEREAITAALAWLDAQPAWLRISLNSTNLKGENLESTQPETIPPVDA